jgi:hypothetical protein
MWESISAIFSTELGSRRGDVRRFSTAKTHPSLVWRPTAVDPSLMASMAYSTWNKRPSGENVFTPRSYSDLVKYIFVIGRGTVEKEEKEETGNACTSTVVVQYDT